MPWQQQPGVWAWVVTMWMILRAPRASTRRFEIEPVRAAYFRRVNIVLAASLLTVLPTVSYGVQLLRSEAPYALRDLTWPWAESAFRVVALLLALSVWWFAVVLVFSFLTGVETWGLRLFGRLHHARITPAVARTVTAHATVGWVVTGVLVSGGFLLGLVLHEHAMQHNVGVVRGPMMLGPIWLPALGGFVGLLAFEMIVYTGVRQCRFANRAKPKA